MDIYDIIVSLFLAIVPAYLAQITHWLPLVSKAYADLGITFARSHPVITTGMLATGSSHIIYETWGQWAHFAEAPLALGIVVVAGYAALLVGLIPAFIRERRIAYQYP